MNTIKELTKLSNGKELDIDNPIYLYDEDGNQVYFEDSDGFWWKSEYEDGNPVYYEDSTGYWSRREYKEDREVYREDSTGYWRKREYDEDREVYCENSNGCIKDNRKTVDMTMAEVCKLLGKKVRIIK